MYLTITKVIKIVWVIDSIDGYGFGHDKKLYNLVRCNEIKQTVNSGCKGYWIKRKFYTLENLKPMLKRPNNFDVPF